MLTPKLPAMVGMETFAMEVSSTCMKVPNARATAVMALRPPSSAGAAPTAAAFALTGGRPTSARRHPGAQFG